MSNRLLKFSLAFVLLGVGAILFAFAYSPTARAYVGARFAYGTTAYLTAGTGTVTDLGRPNATTTKVYLTTTATASSTVSGQLSRGDKIDFDVRAVASSSASNLLWKVETSDSLTSGDWYPVDEATTTIAANGNALLHPLGASVHVWNLATSTGTCGTNEVCKHFSVRDVTGLYYRISFSVSGANAAVFVRSNVVEIVPN